ncbi:uncharacterized protein BX664DRAFT_287690 [Halteromyces radiatus]|uniref:uncharacterized protein n=1 Tax=Halteromyces radiatus TaxID=101107 RepID=UPI00222024D3|nr:uncharacterized protein BX664DRAFT_287690 [Halteromyces radiatus]KAI8076841.1 hypothetical protein BX664DRAFT_287690 [Halteromyces radiatus]
MTETIAPTQIKHFKKPDDAAFKKELEAINERIDKLKKQSDAVKDKISKLPAKQDNTRREEIKAELMELREKQASLKQGRQTVYQQLDAINDSIKKKVGQVKAFQQKVPYKSVAEVDDRIRELEQKIESGVRLVEEKKMLNEISLLKRSRQQVEGLDEQQAAIDNERNIHNEIKKNIDDSEAKKLSERYEELDAEFKKLFGSAAQEREARNKLYEERNRLKGLLDTEYDQLRTLRDQHRKANDEYYTFLRQYKEAKREQERQRKIQLEQEKRQEQLKEELELAALPAFEHEINLCDNLSHFLQGFVNQDDNKSSGASTPAVPANGSPRQVDALPEGMVLAKKSDEDYFVGGKKQRKGGKKQAAKKENTTDTLKLPIATVEGFFEIKVTVPTKVSEIPSTLEKLKERKQYYVDEQPKQTEANKKKAEAKIAAMLEKEKEQQQQEKAEQINGDDDDEEKRSEKVVEEQQEQEQTKDE